MGHEPNDPANRAGNGHPEMRATKLPTRSGRGATVGTADDDILSGGVLPITSDDKFASKEEGPRTQQGWKVGAAAFGMRQVAASAGGGPATGMRCSADSVFARALSDNNNAVAASADDIMAR
jgi:hypothetical protein